MTTITVTTARREVLVNALRAEISALFQCVEEDKDTEYEAHSKKQLKTAKRLLEIIENGTS
jgi:hypothetical protein